MVSLCDFQPSLKSFGAASRGQKTEIRSQISEGEAKRPLIGIIKDSAFQFYYPENLEALKLAGADLVYTSPLADKVPPAVDGFYIGGGFPETHMDELEQNAAMRAAVAAYVEADGPVYAECGGLMYLCRRLTWGAKARKMAGVIPGFGAARL